MSDPYAEPQVFTLSGMDDFPAALVWLPSNLTDGRRVVATVHMATPGTHDVAYAAAYVVDPNTWTATRVMRSSGGKAIGVSLCLVGTTLEMGVTEPPPGGSGAASVMRVYRVPINQYLIARDGIARSDIAAVSARLTALEDA